ncbi:Non-heme 11 kDa protein of cytochrome bc1 complex [Linderina pennispora]|uniref:Non-heme 11 kDa protein of cytochrome bc1 complex n=1 Tax=Linderina pennispora TaxID=61395 RepID=A0A1Y1VZD8_9FUNG|nr:Non-heme 11 kDa protein of cytochrome bc1 complex [Linderina pennispora]ORX66385.1 Non-heme 11 kDa protein of cytochrome bc1 complex [Linderina pennispora]
MSIFDFVSSFTSSLTFHADDEQTETAVAVVETTAVEEEEATPEVIVAQDPVEEEEEEEAEEAEEEEEEEEEDPEDPAPAIREACGETHACKSLKHHLEACAQRVEDGSSESCAEEFLHFLHCVDQCAVPQIFAKLK